ncbi:MAG: CxxH/CxxC protein [bacterium]
MILVCAEHIDRGIDDHIDAIGEPPEILTFSQAGLPPARCAYCADAAGYVIDHPSVSDGEEDNSAL